MNYGHIHRPVVAVTSSAGRSTELLESLKNEFDTLNHDLSICKIQRDDFERKLQGQLGELNTIQQTLYELERNHAKLKQHYEEEIARLRRQLEASQSSGGNGNLSNGGGGIGGGARESFNPPPLFRPNSPGHTQPPPMQRDAPSSRITPNSNLITNLTNLTSTNLNLNNNNSSNINNINTLNNHMPTSVSLLSSSFDNSNNNNNNSNSNNTPSSKRSLSTFSSHLPHNGTSVKRSKSPSNELYHGPLHKLFEDKGFHGMLGASGSGATSEAIPPKNERNKEMADLPALREHKDVFPVPAPPSSSYAPSGGRSTAINVDSSSYTGETKNSPKEELPRRDEGEDNGKDRDWVVGYNPSVQSSLNVDLTHTLAHSSVVCCVKFSSDGKYLATGCHRSAQIYDVESGKKTHLLDVPLSHSAAGIGGNGGGGGGGGGNGDTKDVDLYIRSVSFSPDGQYLATGTEDKLVRVWDIQHHKIQHTFVGHELAIYSLDYSPADGRFMVSGSGDRKVKLWDLEKAKCACTLGNDEVGPKDGVTSVAVSPDGKLVAAGSLDRVVRLWDAQTGYFLDRYEGHLDSVYSVAFSPDGKTLASGSLDKTLKLWDLSCSRARSRCRSTFTGHKDYVLSVAFSGDGGWLISGSKDRSVQFWDPRSAVTHMMLQGHKNSVISVAVSPTGGSFSTGGGDYRARLWKYES